MNCIYFFFWVKKLHILDHSSFGFFKYWALLNISDFFTSKSCLGNVKDERGTGKWGLPCLKKKGNVLKLCWRELPWKWRHLQCLCKQDQPVSATPHQEDVIQAARKMLAQVLEWTFTYFQIKSKRQNSASLWGVPAVVTEILFIMEESSASVISELGASQRACDALLCPGFASHLLWSCEVLLWALGETLENKPKEVMGTRNKEQGLDGLVLHDQHCIAGGDLTWRWSGWVGLGQHPFDSVALDGTALHSKPSAAPGREWEWGWF